MRVKIPTVFTFNLWHPLINRIPIQKFIEHSSIRNLLSQKDSFLIPILNSSANSLEERSSKLSKDVKILLEKNSIEKFNLVSFSITGIDSRIMLNEDKNLKERVQKFLMIGSPNQGCILSDLVHKGQINSDETDLIRKLTGVDSQSLKQLNFESMRKVNDYLDDEKYDNYYTLNGSKEMNDQSSGLKTLSQKILIENEYQNKTDIYNDGLFFINETQSHHFLKELNCNHQELSPFTHSETLKTNLEKFLQ